MTLPEIKAFLAANDVQFAGFVLAPATLHKFAMRFPERAAMTDLDRWHAFESEAPDTFASMYLFAVHKPAVHRTNTNRQIFRLVSCPSPDLIRGSSPASTPPPYPPPRAGEGSLILPPPRAGEGSLISSPAGGGGKEGWGQ